MRIAILLTLLILNACSSDSSSDPLSNLTGTWISNCHALVDGINSSTVYIITTIVYKSDGTFAFNDVSFNDAICTIPNGNTDNYIGTYTVGETLISTDGVNVQTITITQRSIDLPASFPDTEYDAVFRITGIELNFGSYTSGQTPSLNYAVTYLRST